MKKKKLVILVTLMAAIVPSLGLAAQDDISVYNDPQMTARLDRVAAAVNLGVQKLYPKYEGRLRFRVADMDDLNAFALADGRIFVSKGMMAALAARPDDELAAVLNHEAIHVVQKHHMGQAKTNILWRVGTVLLGKAIGASPKDVDTGSQIVTGIASSRYSRKDESRADEGSVDLCAAEGYDPFAPSRVFQMLQDRYGRGTAKVPVIGWFASHPDTADRVKRTTGRAQKYASASAPAEQPVGRVTLKPSNLGGIAVIVRDNAGGGYGFWGGWNSSEEAVKTTMEAALEQTGRFTIVDQAGREDAWREQDLGETGRMDPETMPQKGKTHGAKYFLYVTLNYYEVTQEGEARVNARDGSADVRRVKAEIKGKAKLEPVERSILAYSTDFRGSEVGYDAEASANRGWRGIDARWTSRPAGQAVEAACRKVANDLADYVSLSAESEEQTGEAGVFPATAEKTHQPSAPAPAPVTGAVSRPDPDRVVAFKLYIKPLPSEKGKPVDVEFTAKYGAVNAADYILFLDNQGGEEIVVAKVNIERVRGEEIWGQIEYPYLRLLDISKLKRVRLMKTD